MFEKNSILARMRGTIIAATFLLVTAAAPPLAAEIFTMTWTGGYGPGSATLNATLVGTDEWSIVSMSGNQNGLSISLDPSHYGGADDIFYQPPTFSYLADHAGIAFIDGTNAYNIFTTPAGSTNYMECSSAFTSCYAGDGTKLSSIFVKPDPSGGNGGTRSPTPEPPSFFLVLPAFVAFLVFAVRKVQTSQALGSTIG